MSFAAVIALVSYYEHEKEKATITPNNVWWRYIISPTKAVAITTTLATLATAPFTITHFGRITLYAVLANALAIPLTAMIIMPAVLMFFMLYPFNLDHFAAFFLKIGIAWLVEIARIVSSIPYSLWICPPLFPWAETLFLTTFIAGGLCWAIGKPPLRRIGGALTLLSFGLTFFAKPYDVICQKEPFILAISSGKQATFIGSTSQFLISQWSKALGIDEKQATLVPICHQGLNHSVPKQTKYPCLHFTNQKPIKIGSVKISQTSEGIFVDAPHQQHLLNDGCPQVALSMDRQRLEKKCLSRTTLFW
jgi:competence protein ComEC